MGTMNAMIWGWLSCGNVCITYVIFQKQLSPKQGNSSSPFCLARAIAPTRPAHAQLKLHVLFIPRGNRCFCSFLLTSISHALVIAYPSKSPLAC